MKVYLKDGTTWSEPHFQMKWLKLDNWLIEEYRKINLNIVEELIDTLLDFHQGKLNLLEFYEKCLPHRIVFLKQSTDSFRLESFKFDPNLGVTIVPVSTTQINKLLEDSEYRKEYTRQLKIMVVHEDTHKQQFDRYDGYSEGYELPESLNPFQTLSSKDIAYFSQTIEADAYGREVGESLIQAYPEKSAYWIFENVIRKNVTTDIEEILAVYRNPKIPKKAFQHFWRALYDYLVEEKDPDSKKESCKELNEVYEMLIKALKEKKVSQVVKF